MEADSEVMALRSTAALKAISCEHFEMGKRAERDLLGRSIRYLMGLRASKTSDSERGAFPMTAPDTATGSKTSALNLMLTNVVGWI